MPSNDRSRLKALLIVRGCWTKSVMVDDGSTWNGHFNRISVSWRFAHRGRLEVLVAAVAVAVQEGHVWWLGATNRCYYTYFYHVISSLKVLDKIWYGSNRMPPVALMILGYQRCFGHGRVTEILFCTEGAMLQLISRLSYSLQHWTGPGWCWYRGAVRAVRGSYNWTVTATEATWSNSIPGSVIRWKVGVAMFAGNTRAQAGLWSGQKAGAEVNERELKLFTCF